MESSDDSLDGDLGEQTILNKDKNSERVIEWVGSSIANNILSTTLCSNRTGNECKKMVFSKLRTHYHDTKRIIS